MGGCVWLSVCGGGGAGSAELGFNYSKLSVYSFVVCVGAGFSNLN